MCIYLFMYKDKSIPQFPKNIHLFLLAFFPGFSQRGPHGGPIFVPSLAPFKTFFTSSASMDDN